MNFVPPSEHQVLVFLVQLAVLLALARLLGQACKRLGQPAVVGELAAGVLLGPSVLGRAAPDAFNWLFPADSVQSGMLFTVGWLGVMLLLVTTGFETDLTLIGRLGRAVLWVTIGSLVVPFAFGVAGGVVIPESFLTVGEDRVIFALFLATALTISSLPVIATILADLRLLRRNFGQLTIAAGMANDVVGWILLGLIAGLVSTGQFELGDFLTTLVGLLVFLAIAVAVGQRIVDRVLLAMRRTSVGTAGWLTMAIVISVGLGAITQALGVEAVLGAFVAGILLGRSRYTRHDVEEQIETVTSSLLAPVFFATAGLRVDVALLADSTVLFWAFLLTLLASVSKFGGSWIGARMAGLEHREGFALGMALNARGALGIIIATVGLDLGVFNASSYVITVVMAIATSVVAPPALRALVSGWAGSPEEQARLKREEQLAGNIVVRPGHLLLPVNDASACDAVASLVGRTFPPEMSVTLVETDEVDGDGDRGDRCTAALGDRSIDRRAVAGDPLAEVSNQLQLGYDLVVAAVSPRTKWPDTDELTASILSQRDVPVLLVRPTTTHVEHDPPGGFRRILLPVSATKPSRAAAEIAIAYAAETGAIVKLLHVNPNEGATPVRRFVRTALRTHERIVGSYADPVGQQLIETTEALAAESGVRCERIFSTHQSRAEAILDAASTNWCDLVLLGVEGQDIGGAAFLGQTARRVLSDAQMSVAVMVLPPR